MQNRCPVCLNKEGTSATSVQYGTRDALLIDCDKCGRFAIGRTALADRRLADERALNPVQRAAISYRLRQNSASSNGGPPLVMSDWIDNVAAMSPREILPSPSLQAANLIRFIAEHELRTGQSLPELPRGVSSILGCFNDQYAKKLAHDLVAMGILNSIPARTMGDPHGLIDISLTLNGWDRYESESGGHFAAKYGFMALDFKNPYITEIKDNVLGPAVQSLGFSLLDMRDMAQAGLIDNLMRERIRDAAFVVIDLTDENRGAYWEGGYAEGLGKPVIYVCCEDGETAPENHFDVNHCTTVFWRKGQEEAFAKVVMATLRRSLGLFS